MIRQCSFQSLSLHRRQRDKIKCFHHQISRAKAKLRHGNTISHRERERKLGHQVMRRAPSASHFHPLAWGCYPSGVLPAHQSWSFTQLLRRIHLGGYFQPRSVLFQSDLVGSARIRPLQKRWSSRKQLQLLDHHVHTSSCVLREQDPPLTSYMPSALQSLCKPNHGERLK